MKNRREGGEGGGGSRWWVRRESVGWQTCLGVCEEIAHALEIDNDALAVGDHVCKVAKGMGCEAIVRLFDKAVV